MDAVRLMRAITGRDILLKIEGSYHGHDDAVMVSVAPPATRSGPTTTRCRVPQTLGISRTRYVELTRVVPFNDLDALERTLAPLPGPGRRHDRRAGMMNAGFVLPEDGLPGGRQGAAARRRRAAHLRRGEDRRDHRLRRRHRAVRGHSRPDLPGQVGRRRPSLRRDRRHRRGHGLDRRRPDRPGRHVQRQPAHDGGDAGHADRDPDPRRPTPSSTAWARSCGRAATASSSAPASRATPRSCRPAAR